MNWDQGAFTRVTPNGREATLPAVSLGDVARDAFEKMRRRWAFLAAFMIAAIALGLYNVMNATPVYTANGALLIDPRVAQNPEDGSQMMPGLLMSDALTVDSEIRVLASREVTSSAIKALGITDGTKEIVEPGVVQKVKAFFAPKPEIAPSSLSPELLEERRLEMLRRNFARHLKIQRAGDSFVIEVTYSSPNIAFAPEAVNTLMREYLRQSGLQSAQLVERNQAWLSDRLEELRIDLSNAETAVADYRRSNNLLTPEGALLPTEVALNAAIEELVKLRARALAYEVQVSQLSEQITAGTVGSIQIPVEDRTSTLAEFEASYADLQQREKELLLIWDDESPAVVGVRQKIQQIQELILGEYVQIRDRLRTQQVATERQVVATENVLTQLREQYGDETGKTLELRNLEREANAKRELYERLLEEFNSAAQLVSYDGTSARVIAWAVVPDTKSSPKSKQVIILAAFAGLILAISGVIIYEALDQSFRTQSQLNRKFQLPFLGVVPSFDSDRNKGRWVAQPNLRRTPRWKKLPKSVQRFDFTSAWPASVGAETMRSMHVKLSLQKEKNLESGHAGAPGVVIGMTSSVRDEGKTTTAFNFATFLASQGENVVLVDMDLISREMSRLVSPILPGNNKLSSLLYDVEMGVRNLDIIPEFPNLKIVGNTGDDRLNSVTPREAELIEGILAHLRTEFDYVVLDLAPVLGAPETQLLSTLCDRLIYLVKWGATPQEQVGNALGKFGVDRDKILGVLFTRARLRLYQSYNRNELSEYYR